MTAEEPFHDLAAAIDYPMYIVTAASGGEQAGCLVGFATQCSISPLRFLVCVSRLNHTFRVAADAEVVAVHLADASHPELAELFGTRTGDEVDKFTSCRWVPGPDGVPLLDDLPTRFVGRIVQRVDAGDHLALITEVVQAWSSEPVRPLTFQQVRDLEPGHPA